MILTGTIPEWPVSHFAVKNTQALIDMRDDGVHTARL